jgi:hypothetical protein
VTFLDEAGVFVASDSGSVEIEDVETDSVKPKVIEGQTHDFLH